MKFKIAACIEDYDVEGAGNTWEDMLLSYAADCRRAAATYQFLVDALLKEAERSERLAGPVVSPPV
jgi:hypothetical protein